jgi:drug/metabolite transporter (DMT)-like permease
MRDKSPAFHRQEKGKSRIMIGTELWALLCGLGSAAAWGAGDFRGGLASRRSDVYMVVMVAEAVGTIPLMAFALLWGGAWPPLKYILWAGLGGFFGVVGLLALYRALAVGRMGVVAPVTSVMAAALPLLLGSFWDGLPTFLQMSGILVALGAVWLLSRTEADQPLALTGLGLPILAGTAFGLYFVCIDLAIEESLLWILVIARLAAVAVLLVFLAMGPRRPLPSRNMFPLLILSGLCDVAGNGFFALATQIGRLDIAAVLASFYPGTTALLAWIVLKERLNRTQWMGVSAALAALVLIALP